MKLFREEIETLQEYHLKVYPHRIKLNQNENPFEMPAFLKEKILERLAREPWSRYPAFVPDEQMEQIAAFTGWKREGVLLGNGSNELLQLVITCLLERGKTVVISQPTFSLYKLLAQSVGAQVCEVPMLRPFAFDVDGIIAAAQRTDATMIIVCSPNNPTGTTVSESDVRRMVDATHALVVLDEAYVQFAEASLTPLLADLDRLVVLQTFSKAMGAAGLRFGYLLGHPSVTANLNKVKLPYNVNIFTLLAVSTLIEHWESVRKAVNMLVAERERVYRHMIQWADISVAPSKANFLLIETLRRSPAEVFRALLSKGILVRDVSSYPMLERGLRVTIGTPEQNDEFLATLREAV